MSAFDELESDPLAPVRALLTERGPMTTAALAAEFGEDEDSFVDALGALDDDSIVWLLGDRWADALSLLAGRVVTHRLTSVEVTHDVLTTSPDLELVRSVPDRYRRLVCGELLGTVFPGLAEPDQRDIPEEVRDRDGSFVLPVRTMSVLQVEPGDLVALSISADGVDLRRIEDTKLGDPGPVQQALIDVLDPDQPSLLEPALLTVCAEAPEAFRTPVLPARDLMAAAGLAHDGDYLAPAGFPLAEYQDRTRRRSLAQQFDLSEPEAHATMVLSSTRGTGSRGHQRR